MRWSTEITDIEDGLPLAVRIWMAEPPRLSDALERVSDQFSVQVLREGFGKYFDDEALALEAQDLSQCYTRHVLLLCDQLPVCFARTVMPIKTYEHHKPEFNRLGTQPLGDTLLYSNSRVTRGDFQFNQISTGHPYYQFIDGDQALGARRSVFRLDRKFPLLVTEVFLTTIPEYISESEVV